GSGFGQINAPWGQIEINQINPLNVSMYVSNPPANFSVNENTYLAAGFSTTFGNPDFSCQDSFNYRYGDMGQSFSSQCYEPTNGKIFTVEPQYNNKNQSIWILNFTNKFNYSSNNYNFEDAIITYYIKFKNGTILTANQTPITNSHFVITEQNASAALYNTYKNSNPDINSTYANLVNASITVNYQVGLKAGQASVKILDYPGSVGNLTMTVNNLNKQVIGPTNLGSGITEYEIGLTVPSSVSTYQASFVPTFKTQGYIGINGYNYVLVIYDNSTNSYVSQYSSFKNIISGPVNINLNGHDNYTVYVLYFVPINVTTDFLNKPQAFGTYFGWQTFPYNITNVVNNGDISVNKATNMYFSLPTEASSYIPGYTPQQVTIQEGFYNRNGQFTSTTMTISDYNNMQNCYTTGEVGQCLVEGIIGGVPFSGLSFTGGSTISNTTPFWNYTYLTTSVVSQGNGFYLYTSYYQTFAYSLMSSNSKTLWFDRYDVKTSYANLDAIMPLNITLNYGYIIPVFLSYNINVSGTISSCQKLNSLTYSNLYNYLTATTTPFICSGLFGNTKEYVAESYDDTIYVYNTSSSFIINDVYYYRNSDGSQSSVNYGLSAEFVEQCTASVSSAGQCHNNKNYIYNNYTVYGYYNSTISGFGSSPIVDDEGSSQEISNGYQYKIQATSYPSASTINAYAFYETTS
ncbi:MAG: hypothetical protein QW478_13585, partial [Candidatus Micrarchaeaceae archaeon]